MAVTVRAAKISDIPAILDIIEEGRKLSVYAAVGDIDPHYARAMFGRAMRFNGGHGDGACLFLVSERDGKVRGYFLGVLDRTYQIGATLTANEVHFYLPQDADQRDVLRILAAFTEWALKNPKVVEIKIGESNVFGEPDGRFAALLERKGFAMSAKVFTKAIAR